ncbi:hypothetical protein KL86PLE_41075 [uncultured Pleomorphomonas sp.]|uniref:PIN domain-containing protein n=1 Tax=uncultured Pleomorphomonas sp. TaxID=442121 RepID=A0A212LID8_9HYPH|nr:PIN domain-containing protein [uncultured Pleomorphomonas sp.]SCM77270.1 hypothetical protein KL86PLE_41075 [uncultured Pleomorphomonas sp.]
MILLDTNVLSELIRQRPERRVVDWVDSRERGDLSVTAITIMELRFGIEVMPAGHRRRATEAEVRKLLEVSSSGVSSRSTRMLRKSAVASGPPAAPSAGRCMISPTRRSPPSPCRGRHRSPRATLPISPTSGLT